MTDGGKYNIWSLKMCCKTMKYEELFKAGNFILPYEEQENNVFGVVFIDLVYLKIGHV